jgi:carboxymethylenebutenolidase
MIEIAASGGAFQAYLAAPDTGRAPGVVLASSIFGLTQNMKDKCDDLARRGFVAMVQNLFWRDQDSGPLQMEDFQRAVARAERLEFPKSMDDLARAIAEVKRHPYCNGKIAVFGFCLGGPYAWRAACDGLGVDATVSFHGTFVSKYMRPGDTPSCPVSFNYGDKDQLAPPPELDAVTQVAKAVGSEVVIHAGAGHGYMMHAHNREDEEAARTSWNRALHMVDALRTEAAAV